MSRKEIKSELPPEILDVILASPNLEPCDEFKKSDIVEFFEHLKERPMPEVHRVLSAMGEGIGHDALPQTE